MAVLLLSDRRLQGNRLLGNLQDFTDTLHRKLHFLSNFLRGRFTSQFLQKLSGYTNQLVDSLHHVDRNPDCTGLVRNGPCDGLANPPGRIGTELISLAVIKLFNGFDQS